MQNSEFFRCMTNCLGFITFIHDCEDRCLADVTPAPPPQPPSTEHVAYLIRVYFAVASPIVVLLACCLALVCHFGMVPPWLRRANDVRPRRYGSSVTYQTNIAELDDEPADSAATETIEMQEGAPTTSTTQLDSGDGSDAHHVASAEDASWDGVGEAQRAMAEDAERMRPPQVFDDDGHVHQGGRRVGSGRVRIRWFGIG